MGLKQHYHPQNSQLRLGTHGPAGTHRSPATHFQKALQNFHEAQIHKED